eukprot:Sspe_Gene.50396::Locus_28004_Transcript_1_1_Confidence_1.000_Length_821::g.50396::m.50396/K00459/ncd2, npd; nitronate monooxygenase
MPLPARCRVLCDLLRIRHPIIQAPMAGVSNLQFVAEASRRGVLGSHGVAYFPPDRIASEIKGLSESLADLPYAINIFVQPHHSVPRPETYRDANATLQPIREMVGVHPPETPLRPAWQNFAEQFEVVLASPPPVLSTTFGALTKEQVSALHAKGVVVMGTATTVAEAKLLADTGVDVIVVQGYEAGGHRGSFLEESAEGIGMLTLVQQVCDAVRASQLLLPGV